MKTNKIDLTGLGAMGAFASVYQIYAKDYLLSNDYTPFAEMVQETFILTPLQWEYLLVEWQIKEEILKVR